MTVTVQYTGLTDPAKESVIVGIYCSGTTVSSYDGNTQIRKVVYTTSNSTEGSGIQATLQSISGVTVTTTA